jgi:dihydroneopterin triphosphate diphosphatase
MLRRPFSAHVFLYRRTVEGTFEFMLLFRRPRTSFGLPAFWQGITGALEAGESFADGARREVREETGLDGITLHFTGYATHYPIKPEWRVHFGDVPEQVEERAACGEVPAGSVPVLSDEHSDWGWFSVAQAMDLLVAGHNRESFESVINWLHADQDHEKTTQTRSSPQKP